MPASKQPEKKPKKPGRKPIPKTCRYCKQTFPSTRAAREHQWGDECPQKPKDTTAGRPGRQTPCPYCQTVLPTVRKMLAHRATCIFKPRKRRRKNHQKED